MKRLFVLALALALTLSLAACGGGKKTDDFTSGDDNTSAAPKNSPTASSSGDDAVKAFFAAKDEITSKMTNYFLTMKVTNADGTSTLSKELYAKGDALIVMMDDSASVTYSDYKNNKAYVLDTEAKTGYDSGSVSDKGTGGMILSTIVTFGMTQGVFMDNDTIKIEKVGTETVAGQKTTVYSYTFNGVTQKFWIDDQYGMALKTETTTTQDGTQSWEVTEFKAGGVTPADWINLGDYTIS